MRSAKNFIMLAVISFAKAINFISPLLIVYRKYPLYFLSNYNLYFNTEVFLNQDLLLKSYKISRVNRFTIRFEQNQ